MGRVAANLQAVNALVVRLSAPAGRAVEVLAVTKACPPEAVREAWAAGQRKFAESYLQEALPKIAALADLVIEWHFIGPVQSNKTRPIAENFAWVHSIDREKIARRLSEQRPAHLPPLNVLLQVHVSNEATKSGVEADAALQLARAIALMPGVRLRGVMAMAGAGLDEPAQRAQFRVARETFERLRADGLPVDTLSMGMSGDLAAAIAEGSTLVRIGTAIFGARPAGTPESADRAAA